MALLFAGFAVNGDVDEQKVMTKSAASPEDVLILSKPLGTGVLLAGDMQGKAKGRWIAGVIQYCGA